MEQVTGRFKAVDDSTGEEYTVLKYRHAKEKRDLDGKISRTFGLPRLALEDGSAVTPIDDKTFKIVHTDVIIRKVD